MNSSAQDEPMRRAAVTAVGMTLVAGAVMVHFMLGGAAPVSVADCAECPEMVVIPAGEFTMGSPPSEMYRGAEAQHRVRVPSFAFGKYEVTFAQWDACVAGGGCGALKPDDYGWGRGNRTVIGVSWNDAKVYVA